MRFSKTRYYQAQPNGKYDAPEILIIATWFHYRSFNDSEVKAIELADAYI